MDGRTMGTTRIRRTRQPLCGPRIRHRLGFQLIFRLSMRRPRRRSQLVVRLPIRPCFLPRRARALLGAAMVIPRFLPISRRPMSMRTPTRQPAVRLAVLLVDQLAIRRCILPRRQSHRHGAAMGTRRGQRSCLPLALSRRAMGTIASRTGMTMDMIAIRPAARMLGDLRSSVFPDRTR